MIIGIDISQIVYGGTGVGIYVKEMVETLVYLDRENTYVLFGSSFRKHAVLEKFVSELQQKNSHVFGKLFWFTPSLLDLLWNKLHIMPVTWFIGAVDIFWSSDWTQPPLGSAKGITTIHDITILKSKDVMSKHIQAVHRRKLQRSMTNCSLFLCDSESTKNDVRKLLKIPEEKLRVVYPGLSI